MCVCVSVRVLKLANLICNLDLSEMIEELIVSDHQKASKSGVLLAVPFNQFWTIVFYATKGSARRFGEKVLSL